jgi:hypothetical protein
MAYLCKSLVLLFVLSYSTTLNAQDTLAGWTFPTGQPADTLADFHIAINSASSIHTAGVSGLTTFTNGATTYAATATGWDGGTGVKCWMAYLSTLGYENIKLSSKQRSGGNNPGPRDFLVQYRIGGGGDWTEVPGSTVIVANDWSGELLNIPLPAECENLQEIVFLRWVMASNTNSQGEVVTVAGISKIDDVFITADIITALPMHNTGRAGIYPNPCRNCLNVENIASGFSMTLYDSRGERVVPSLECKGRGSLDMESLSSGVYFLEIKADEGTIRKKIIKTEAY